MKHQQTFERLEILKNQVLEHEAVYNIATGKNIEYEKAYFKAMENNDIITIDGSELYMTMANLNNKRYVLTVYAMSSKEQPKKNKEISQTLCKIVDCLEKVFIYLNKLYIVNNQNEADRIIWLVALKELSEFTINEKKMKNVVKKRCFSLFFCT